MAEKWTLTNSPNLFGIGLGGVVSDPTGPDQTTSFSPPCLTQSCPEFSPPTSPQPPGLDESLGPSLALDDSLLEFCLKSVMATDPAPSTQESTKTPGLTDNLLTDSFTDISTLIDSSMLNLLPSDEADEMTFEFPEDALGLSSPSVTVSGVATPISLSPSLVVPSSPFPTPPESTSPFPTPESTSPHTETPPLDVRKRKTLVANDDDEATPPAKISKEDREVEKRKKNNIASQVSRAKKRSRVKDLFEREKELEVQNAELRLKAEELTKEAEKLRALLINQLAK